MLKMKQGLGSTYWGLALAWYGDYTQGGNPNPYIAKMDFLAKYGMKSFQASPQQIDALCPKEQEELFTQLADRDMHIIFHANISQMEEDNDTMDRVTEKEAKLLEKYIKPCRSDIITSLCTQPPL